MTAREIAALWIIGLAGIAIIIWDHRAQAQNVVNALSGPSGGVANNPGVIIPGPSTGRTTNNATPMAGNEFGFLATYGNALSGDASPSGPDFAFSDIFNSLNGA